jgi:hypothetical protein
VSACLDETRVAELAEMARGRRLRDVEDLHEIADAQLALAEDVQDAQSRPIGEGLEQRVDRL